MARIDDGRAGTGAEPEFGLRVAPPMASRTRTSWEERSPVASELEAIFAPLPRLAPASTGPDTGKPAARRGGLWLWATLLAVVALAALVGSLAFLTPIAYRAPALRHPAPAAPLPVHTPPAPLPQATPPETQAAILPEAPQLAPTPPSKPAPPKRRRATTPAGHHEACPRFATEAWCLHGTIMASDNELRAAYASAVRAGVEHGLLVDVRSDWKRLRGRANHDPQALIRGYALLTQELRAETRRARR